MKLNGQLDAQMVANSENFKNIKEELHKEIEEKGKVIEANQEKEVFDLRKKLSENEINFKMVNEQFDAQIKAAEAEAQRKLELVEEEKRKVEKEAERKLKEAEKKLNRNREDQQKKHDKTDRPKLEQPGVKESDEDDPYIYRVLKYFNGI